jgi:hypothetical protein
MFHSLQVSKYGNIIKGLRRAVNINLHKVGSGGLGRPEKWYKLVTGRNGRNWTGAWTTYDETPGI